MMPSVIRKGALALAALVLSALSASAQVAGPVEVFTNVFKPVVSHSDFGDVGCEVRNQSSGSDVGVIIEADVTYADGTRQRILGPTPAALPPNNATILFIAFLIPPGAGNGTAVFECRARVGRISGETNHGDYTNPIVASDRSPFEVVP